MKTYQIKITHYDSLFNNIELNYISAKNMNEAIDKVNRILKLKKQTCSLKSFFITEQSKIKKVEIICEVG